MKCECNGPLIWSSDNDIDSENTDEVRIERLYTCPDQNCNIESVIVTIKL